VTDDDPQCSGQKTEPNHPEITRKARLEIQGIPTFCLMELARTQRPLRLACSHRCSHRERVCPQSTARNSVPPEHSSGAFAGNGRANRPSSPAAVAVVPTTAPVEGRVKQANTGGPTASGIFCVTRARAGMTPPIRHRAAATAAWAWAGAGTDVTGHAPHRAARRWMREIPPPPRCDVAACRRRQRRNRKGSRPCPWEATTRQRRGGHVLALRQRRETTEAPCATEALAAWVVEGRRREACMEGRRPRRHCRQTSTKEQTRMRTASAEQRGCQRHRRGTAAHGRVKHGPWGEGACAGRGARQRRRRGWES